MKPAARSRAPQQQALESADPVVYIERKGVIDLRSVVPLDAGAVVESVARTRRLLVVDEDYLSFGLPGEVVARVLELLGPRALEAVARHAVPDVPIPAARTLEEVVIPRAETIVAAIRSLAR